MRERDIFIEVLQKADQAERLAYLDIACAGDDALRERVLQLLAEHENQESFFLDAPPYLLANLAGETIDYSANEAVGTLIGPYKLLEQIGEGGMGTVWMAQQTEPVKRVVALKLIRPGMDSKQVIARFEAERQALALMDHVNIARVLDAGTTDAGRPFFVMDLVKGVPITRYCDEHRLTLQQRLEMFIPVCQAVQHAHQKGIIHRDLKPGNVLVALYDGKPVPKVIDFGVAKATGQSLTEKTLVTGFGAIVGTLEYMSPEQAELNQVDIDTRSDIYSLGVLLYELLAGSPPFRTKDLEKAGVLEMLRVIREKEPSRPSTMLSTADGLPKLAANRSTEPKRLTKLMRGELDWIVMKALEKDRNRRFETANGFAMDLQRFLADEPVQACPPSAAYRFRKFARRNKRMLTTAMVIFVALILAVGSLAITAAALNDSKTRVESALGEKTEALENLHEEKRKADDALAGEYVAAYYRAIAVAHLAFLTGDLDQANAALDDRPEAQRQWEWHYLKRLCQTGKVVYRIGRLRPHQFAITPDGRVFAHTFSNTLSVYDTRAQKVLLRLREERSVGGQPILSPDGRQFAFANGNSVRVWDLETGKETHKLTGPRIVNRALFQPGGRLLAWGSPGEIHLTELKTQKELGVLRTAPSSTSWVFTADGARLVVCATGGLVEVWEVAVGVRAHAHKENVGTVSVAVSSDGRYYAVPTPSGVRVCEMETGRAVQFLPTPNLLETGGDRLSIAFSPDDQRLVHTSFDNTVRVWDLKTGHQTRAFTNTQSVWYAGFTDEGRSVLTVDAAVSVSVRDVESGPQGLMVRPARDPADTAPFADIMAAAFSFDGRLIAAGCTDGSVRVVASDTGALVLELPKQVRSFRGALAFSRDGRWLASSVSSEHEVQVWDIESRSRMISLPLVNRSVDFLGFSPDGKQLAARAVEDKTSSESLCLWETSFWNEIKNPWTFGAPKSGRRFRVAYSTDGGQLALTTGDDRVILVDAATAAQERVIREPGCSFGNVAFESRGGLMAAFTTEGVVHLWHAATGEHRRILRGPPGQASSLAFSPDGRRLACSTIFPNRNPEVRLWDVETGRTPLVLSELGSVMWLQFSADGQRLMTAARQQAYVRVWDGSPLQQKDQTATAKGP